MGPDVTPTLEQVAELAGVSRSTASRAINGGEKVSAKAQAAVDQAIRELGFTPNRAARTLVTRRTDSVALVVPEPDEFALGDPFVVGTLTGLSAALADTDLQLVLLIARPGGTQKAARYLRRGNVDGAVVASHHRDDGLETALIGSRLPHVFIGRPLSGGHGAPYVDVDNVEGGRIAARRLLHAGAVSPATVAGPPDMAVGRDRLEGWRQVVARAGRRTDAVDHGDFTAEGGAASMERLLAAHPDIDAVFAASDLMAVGVLRVLAAHGRRVPQDVAVVGFDDLGVAATTVPPLTTVINPVATMARRAGAILLDCLAGATAPGPLILPTSLVERAST